MSELQRRRTSKIIIGAEFSPERQRLAQIGSRPEKWAAGEAAAMRYALSAGDDYELLFTAPAAARRRIEGLAPVTPVSLVGEITGTQGVHLQGSGLERDLVHGFDHFTD